MILDGNQMIQEDKCFINQLYLKIIFYVWTLTDTDTANTMEAMKKNISYVNYVYSENNLEVYCEDPARCYFKHQKEEFYKKFYWILALQNEISKQDPMVEEVPKNINTEIVTRVNIVILKTFADHVTSKIWMNKSILLFLNCLTKIIIIKDLRIRCNISLVFY